jgi:hypothetical protein
MASAWFTDVQARSTEVLDFTSLTLEEFQTLVPPFDDTPRQASVRSKAQNDLLIYERLPQGDRPYRRVACQRCCAA